MENVSHVGKVVGMRALWGKFKAEWEEKWDSAVDDSSEELCCRKE